MCVCDVCVCVCVCVAKRTAMDFYVENCSKCRTHLPITSGKINFTLGSSLQESRTKLDLHGGKCQSKITTATDRPTDCVLLSGGGLVARLN